MTNLAQVSLFEEFDGVVIPTAKPKGKTKDNGKRKTKDWAPKKAMTEVEQDGLAFETLPLNYYDWDDDYQAHEALLKQSLSPCLRGNVSMDYLNEIINWVVVPIFKDGSTSIQPFSFQACCIASGVNASLMQEQVFPELQKAFDNAMKN